MKRMQWLGVCVAISGLVAVGCGDDDTTPVDGGATDTGTTDTGPMMPSCPAAAGDIASCCAKASNAERQANPQFRIAALALTAPSSLASPILAGQLGQAIDEERFNWLVEVTGAEGDGAVTIRTGFGRLNADGSFSFANGDADPPGDPDRWNAQEVEGTLAGEVLTSPPLADVFSVPVVSPDGENVLLELPLNSFELLMATMSDDRTCIGERAGRVFDTAGEVRTYITIEAAKEARVEAPPVLNASLCNLLRGAPGAGFADCEDTPREMWTVQPDANCDEMGVCEACSGETCNAWRVEGGFAAQGVNITD